MYMLIRIEGGLSGLFFEYFSAGAKLRRWQKRHPDKRVVSIGQYGPMLGCLLVEVK